MISINLSNAYTGGYSLLNAFPSFGRVNCAILFGTAATILSCFPIIVEQAEQYISLLGAAIIPLSAIIVFDFVWIKNRRIIEEDLLTLMGGKNLVNQAAFFTVLFFIPVYLLIPAAMSPGFIVFILAGISYCIMRYWIRN